MLFVTAAMPGGAGANLFVYALNNPVMFVDPSGYAPVMNQIFTAIGTQRDFYRWLFRVEQINSAVNDYIDNNLRQGHLWRVELQGGVELLFGSFSGGRGSLSLSDSIGVNLFSLNGTGMTWNILFENFTVMTNLGGVSVSFGTMMGFKAYIYSFGFNSNNFSANFYLGAVGFQIGVDDGRFNFGVSKGFGFSVSIRLPSWPWWR